MLFDIYIVDMTNSDSQYTFKFSIEHSLEHRKQESLRLRSSFNSRIPIILEKDSHCPYSDMQKHSLLPPDSTKLSTIISIIRKRLKLPINKPLYIYANGTTLLDDCSNLSQIYEKHKQPDGFLYLLYHNQFKSL